jgi:hypothetical protein
MVFLPSFALLTGVLFFHASQFPADSPQSFLFAWFQAVHLFHNLLRVPWEYLAYEPAAIWRQMDHDLSLVVLLSLAANPPVLFKVGHNERNVPATTEELFGQGLLAHRSQVEQCFQDPKLARRQSFGFKLKAHPRHQGIRCARQIDEGI